MKDKQNHEIEELISACLDGQASQRQQTELKRLMLHDPQMNQRIKLMERQKQILNALPVETAPEDLADQVRAALERRLILDSTADHHHVAGEGRLRRLVNVAAMFLLPLGLLGLIVYQIMKPPSLDPIAPAPIAQVDNGTFPDVVTAQLPFEGVLTFQTRQLMTVSAYVEKMMFDHGLMEMAVPERLPDATAYLLKASPEKIAALLDSIRDTWGRSTSVSLTVPAGPDAAAVEISNISIEQVKTLAAQQNAASLAQLAVQYAAANQKSDTLYANRNTDQLGPDGLPLMNQPILTGRYDRSPVQPDQTQQVITLRIQIERSTE